MVGSAGVARRRGAHSTGYRCGRSWSIALAVLGLAGCGSLTGPSDGLPGRDRSLSDSTLTAIATVVAHTMRGDAALRPGTALDASLETPALVYAALRARGRLEGTAWGTAATWGEAIADAVSQARRSVAPGRLDAVETVELALAYQHEALAREHYSDLLSDVHRGVHGLEIVYEGQTRRISPTEMIATNQSFKQVIRTFAQEQGQDILDLLDEVTFRTFWAHQVLVTLEATPQALEMFRGNQIIPQAAVTRERVQGLADRMTGWMIRHVHTDGRMTYIYFPSREEETDANHMIRQWMATICVDRIAREHPGERAIELAERNMRYNLEHFYRTENGLGLIEYQGRVNLGAVALAAIAILEHPNRASFAEEEAALIRTTHHLWQADGSFQTYYRPPERHRGQHYYPGETLLLWAMLYAESQDEALRERFTKSVAYYHTWHLANRNPAFVPWHTQAYYLMWQDTQDAGLRDWVFEMNDWLLGMQARSRVGYDDTEGRFYDPTQPFGPPHAASNGVYLEGLIDAYELARRTGAASRAESYRQAIVRGLRSALQLAFTDEVDLFYVSNREAVRGGLRSSVYRSEIRVDNVQHTLMGVQKILRVFQPADYRLAGS